LYIILSKQGYVAPMFQNFHRGNHEPVVRYEIFIL